MAQIVNIYKLDDIVNKVKNEDGLKHFIEGDFDEAQKEVLCDFVSAIAFLLGNHIINEKECARLLRKIPIPAPNTGKTTVEF